LKYQKSDGQYIAIAAEKKMGGFCQSAKAAAWLKQSPQTRPELLP